LELTKSLVLRLLWSRCHYCWRCQCILLIQVARFIIILLSWLQSSFCRLIILTCLRVCLILVWNLGHTSAIIVKIFLVTIDLLRASIAYIWLIIVILMLLVTGRPLITAVSRLIIINLLELLGLVIVIWSMISGTTWITGILLLVLFRIIAKLFLMVDLILLLLLTVAVFIIGLVRIMIRSLSMVLALLIVH